MLIIANDIVEELLTMSDCIRVQEQAFRQIPTGGAIHRPRVDMYVPAGPADAYYRWGSMEGANDGYFAIRMKSDVITWPRDASGNWTEEKYCVEPGIFCGLILLISTKNGEPLAFINDGVLQHMRVGGGAGIGVKYLSREDSHNVGMIGSGGMARTYLEAFACVRDIRSCRVYSPNRANREAFAREMSAKLKIDVQAVNSAREAVRGCDILSSCTDAMSPVYETSWIEPGMHITNLNWNEMPDDAAPRFDVFVRQGGAGLELVQSERIKAGIGHSPSAFIGGTIEEMKRLPQEGERKTVMGDSAASASAGVGAGKPEFADLITGKCAGRTSAEQVTFYRNVGNQGLQFSSVGGWVYEQALASKRGREIPTAWFLQDVRD